MIRREDYTDATAYLHAVMTARKRKIRLTILIIAASVFSVLLFLYEYYKVRNVIVQGNTRYTDAQVSDLVMTGPLGHNSLYLSLRYANKEVPDVPFVERMDVTVLRHDTIRITVYEMALAGYVDYLGRYMYFSRDGTVVEASNQALSDVPQVLGLKFDHIALSEKLPVEDPSVFQTILDIKQVCGKYEVSPDKIYFDSSGNISLYFDQVRADIGEGDYLDDKISNISRILPSLEGRTGVLKMSQYTPGTRYITFVIKDGIYSSTGSGTDGDEEDDTSQTENFAATAGSVTSLQTNDTTGAAAQTGQNTGEGNAAQDVQAQTGQNTGEGNAAQDVQAQTGQNTGAGDASQEVQRQTSQDTGEDSVIQEDNTAVNTQTPDNTGGGEQQETAGEQAVSQ